LAGGQGGASVVSRMEPSDSAALLASARDGSAEALGLLFERHSRRLLALIRLRLGPSLRAHLESRDVLQETWLKALSHLDGFRGEGSASFMAWMARIAANEIRDRADRHARQRRDAGRETALSHADLDGFAARLRSQTSRVALGESLLRLEQALESLAPDHREVIVLRKLEELSFPEIGERIGRSPDACRQLLARAFAALTVAMEKAS
jgi:RNA polymerase sigma-70 factor, ECF subfamily